MQNEIAPVSVGLRFYFLVLFFLKHNLRLLYDPPMVNLCINRRGAPIRLSIYFVSETTERKKSQIVANSARTQPLIPCDQKLLHIFNEKYID